MSEDNYFKKFIFRFFEKIKYSDDSCWLWIDRLDRLGYARIMYKRKKILAHRFSFEYFVEKIDAWLTIDHLCNVRHCVNPFHLLQVSLYDNIMRGSGPPANYAKRNHCSRGHKYTEKNLILYRRPDRTKRITRLCRECMKMNSTSRKKIKSHVTN